MFTLPVRVSPLLLLRTSSSALILNVVLKISHVHSVNRSRNMARAQTLRTLFARDPVTDEEENLNVVLKVVVELKGLYGPTCSKVSRTFNSGNSG